MSQLRPLGHRILVTPDAQADATDSGLILPSDRDHVSTSGTVVALGDGQASAQKLRRAVIAQCLRILTAEEQAHGHTHGFASRLATAFRDYQASHEKRTGSLAVGDRVAFPAETGLRLTEDGVEYVLIAEDDVVVIVDEQTAHTVQTEAVGDPRWDYPAFCRTPFQPSVEEENA